MVDAGRRVVRITVPLLLRESQIYKTTGWLFDDYHHNGEAALRRLAELERMYAVNRAVERYVDTHNSDWQEGWGSVETSS